MKGSIETRVHNALATEPERIRKEKPLTKSAVERVLKTVAEVCIERKYNPAVEIVDAIQSSEITRSQKAEYARVLLEYIEPKKRSIEHSGSVDMSLPQLLEQVESEWKRRKQGD